MLKLTENDITEVRTWLHRNARPLELALWRYFFEGGGQDDVLSALAFYRNGDGGFGNALEPDSWNPDSTPYTTLYAVNLLKSVGFTDMTHPVYTGILNYLGGGSHFTKDGWPFCVPSNDAHPHAPWWTYSADANAYESIGVTAEISAFILLRADRASALYQKALAEAGRLLKLLDSPGKYGDMGVNGFTVLLDAVEKAGLSDRLGTGSASETVRKLVYDTIVRDAERWPAYCVKPSNYIKSPDSVYYEENADIVGAELDYLIKTRPAGGVWDITWTWFENNDKYPKELAVSANWWRSITAIGNMRYLQSFGRLEL